MTNSLPQSVVVQDKKLVTAAEANQLETAKLRWHWTLDTSNPQRVSIRQYATQVGLGKSSIQDHATGYAMWLQSGGPGAPTRALAECVAVARMSAEKQAETEGIAEATGSALSTVGKGKGTPKVKAAVQAAKHAVIAAKNTAAEQGKKLTTAEIKATASSTTPPRQSHTSGSTQARSRRTQASRPTRVASHSPTHPHQHQVTTKLG